MPRSLISNFRFSVKCTAEESWYDEDKLEKILTNILDNAFKYTPANGRVGFSVSAERKGTGETYAIFCHIRHWPGNSGSEHERIFEGSTGRLTADTMHRQRDRHRSLIKKMAALHHGTVEVDSQRVRFRLYRTHTHRPQRIC
ncbi:MAG: hypothetical protein R2758_11855 [Bacteroidales bacterium]